jgi:hypothetical protein
MACDIPAPSKETKVAMDFTAKQEVVKIDILPDPESVERPPAQVPALQALPEYLDNSHKIEIVLGKICIRVGDNADPVMLQTILHALGAVSCQPISLWRTGSTSSRDYPHRIIILIFSKTVYFARLSKEKMRITY